MVSGEQTIVNELCKIREELSSIRILSKASEDRTIIVYYVTIPEEGGNRDFAEGITKIDFKTGTIINPDGTIEYLTRKLDATQDKDFMHSVSIYASQDIKFRLNTSGLQTVNASFLFQLPYVTYFNMEIICTETTSINIFACTNPQATLGNFKVTTIGELTQSNIIGDEDEAQTWDAIETLKNNLNRIRNQIVTITGEAWGTVTKDLKTAVADLVTHAALTATHGVAQIANHAEIASQIGTHAADTSTHGVSEVADAANAYVHPNHSGEVTSAADGAQTIANKQTLSATSPITLSNTPTVVAGAAPVIAIPAATDSVNGYATSTQIAKLDGIEASADVNNISDVNATDLTDAGNSELHYHASDRLIANITDMENQSFQNLIKNGDFESWSAGAAAAPDGFTFDTADTGVLARESTIKKLKTYSAKITAGASWSQLRQAIPNPADYSGKTFTLGCWVYSDFANSVGIIINDTTSEQSSAKHSGGGTWEWITNTKIIHAANTTFSLFFDVRGGTGDIGYFDGAILVEGSVCPAFSPKPASYEDGVPSGLISMWHGLISAIPNGWLLCDGSNSTPDLRSKFLRGAPAATEAGGTGGADTHTLSIAEMPSHKHTYSCGSFSGSVAGYTGTKTLEDCDTSSGSAHNNMPAYYQILFIMKS